MLHDDDLGDTPKLP